MATHVFISYVSADQSHLERLTKHLAALRQQGLLSTWHCGQVGVGDNLDEAVDMALEAAELVLLLVSADFVDSERCYRELGRALERAKVGSARVVPILVRPCDWQGTPFAGFQALPEGGKPVTLWGNQDEAWTQVAEGIRAAVEQRGAGDANAARAAAKASAARTLSPRYADEATRAMSEQLAAARMRLARLAAAGESTLGVEAEILDLRRKLREGGQLRPGDDLGNALM